jgi:hypothetical protein
MALVFEHSLSQAEQCKLHEYMSSVSAKYILSLRTTALPIYSDETLGETYKPNHFYDMAVLTYFSALFYEQYSEAGVDGWIKEHTLIGYKWEVEFNQLSVTHRYGMPVLPYLVKVGPVWHVYYQKVFHRCLGIYDALCQWCAMVTVNNASETEQGFSIQPIVAKCWPGNEDQFVCYSQQF